MTCIKLSFVFIAHRIVISPEIIRSHVITYIVSLRQDGFKWVLANSLIIILGFHEVQSASIRPYPNRPKYESVVRKLSPHIKKDRLKSFVQKLSSFRDRDFRLDYREAERWLEQEIRAALSLYNAGPTYFRKIGDPPPPIYHQNNLIAKLEGKNPDYGTELVILGAHYDTYHLYLGWRSPGADDNATGCAVLLEILRLAAKFGIKFKRTIEFHWYTAKELDNFYGSADVVEKYYQEGIIYIGSEGVKGMLNIDSIGYQQYSYEKRIGVVDSSCKTWSGWRTTNYWLTNHVSNLVKWYVDPKYRSKDVTDVRVPRRCISDNYSWHKRGYKATSLTEYDDNFYLHKEEDTIEKVNFEQVKEYAKLALAFVIELGELHGNLVVTEPPPRPGQEITTEASEMTTGDEDMSIATDSSGLKPGTEDPPDESFAVKLEGGRIKIGACLVGIRLLH